MLTLTTIQKTIFNLIFIKYITVKQGQINALKVGI